MKSLLLLLAQVAFAPFPVLAQYYKPPTYIYGTQQQNIYNQQNQQWRQNQNNYYQQQQINQQQRQIEQLQRQQSGSYF